MMNRYEEMRRHLAEIFRETVRVVNEGGYVCQDGERVILGDDRVMRENTCFYSKPFSVEDVLCLDVPTEISVINKDSIEAGLALKHAGLNPVVLNFASRRNAGGGVINGSRAQEETLFRRTNLFRSLYQFMPYAEDFKVPRHRLQYPMDFNFGGIYTPDATVIRGCDYAFLSHPEQISFVSVAAMNRPRLIGNRIAPEMIGGTMNKMRTILRIGLRHGHDAIVLGAFGCGAFVNPPRHIAELFREVISEDEFRNKYWKIVFAILEDHNSNERVNPNGNLLPFMEVFSKVEAR